MNRGYTLLMAIVAFALMAACVGPTAIPSAEAPAASTSGPGAAASQATKPPAATVEQAPAAAQLSAQSTSPDPVQRLIEGFEGTTEANGDILFLFGQVLDVNGNAVSNARVEIWQTDSSGVYDHPGDPSTDNRDRSFQFFGSTSADDAGWYVFRTVVPGRYEPRPRHIHFKVKQDDAVLLTSQFYFSDDIAVVEEEDMFEAVGERGDLLLLQLVQGNDSLLVNGRIVVDTGIGAGALPLTPSQAEGPYYPVVPLANYDNDLLRLP